MCIMHCLAMKFCTMLRRMLAARGKISMVALAVIEMVIDMSVETIRPMEPRSRADEYSAGEPIRAIVTIRSAVIRRDLIVPVGTNRRFSNTYRNLRDRAVGGGHEKARSNNHRTRIA